MVPGKGNGDRGQWHYPAAMRADGETTFPQGQDAEYPGKRPTSITTDLAAGPVRPHPGNGIDQECDPGPALYRSLPDGGSHQREGGGSGGNPTTVAGSHSSQCFDSRFPAY